MLGIHRWLRVGLLIILSSVLGACSSRIPEPPEPLELTQPITVDQPGQEVRFEFEANARNFDPGRTYALELEVQRQGGRENGEPDMRKLNIPFEVSLQRWGAGAWQDVPTHDSYQALALNAGKPLPAWHTSTVWRYAALSAGSGGEYRWSIVALPLDLDARYRLDVRTVQPSAELKHYSARLKVHAARPVGK
ncbi:hypothetical protein ORG27_18865 [Stenotrophomonas lactitubi]|uniref:hypothetical protein n=1 Tax=Stenotrophomonas lactitubi TaxID=2045214 RepID=UPI00224880A3|nr:hypothetical protein [Stenotrophomonas lactitubi]MCX2895651.1 hypothetical protein [Stenotrophomonas lactitubi]